MSRHASTMLKSSLNRIALIWLLLLSLFAGVSTKGVGSRPMFAHGRALSSSSQQPAVQPETLDSLRARIAAHIAQPRFTAASWGVKIVSLDSGKTVFEHNPQKYFSPASNAKLFTAALALDKLGPDFRIKTSLYCTSRPDANGTVKG